MHAISYGALVLSRGVVIEKSQFLANRGNGIRFDIGNEDCTVRHCLIADNEGAGIFYEISYALHAHDNVIVGNGLLSGTGAWGANGAISLSSSLYCVIERNLMVGNKEGFQFREQRRTTPRIDGKAGSPEEWVGNHDHNIRNNLIACNQDAQVRGWFATDDERHWPLALQRLAALKPDRSENDSVEESVPQIDIFWLPPFKPFAGDLDLLFLCCMFLSGLHFGNALGF